MSANFEAPEAEEQLRDVLALQIFGDRGVMGGADRGEDQRDLVALDQPPRLLHRLRRRVAVVERDQVDLAAVDAAALVDHLEIADLALAERAERRHRPAIGHGLADLDFGCGDAAHFGRHRGGRQHQTSDGAQRANSRDETHRLPSPCVVSRAQGRAERPVLRSGGRKHAMTPRRTPTLIMEVRTQGISGFCRYSRFAATALASSD